MNSKNLKDLRVTISLQEMVFAAPQDNHFTQTTQNVYPNPPYTMKPISNSNIRKFSNFDYIRQTIDLKKTEKSGNIEDSNSKKLIAKTCLKANHMIDLPFTNTSQLDVTQKKLKTQPIKSKNLKIQNI